MSDNTCFVCGWHISDHSKAKVILAHPCYLIAHDECSEKFIATFKRYYGFIIDIEKMEREFNKQWGFDKMETEGPLLAFMKEEPTE